MQEQGLPYVRNHCAMVWAMGPQHGIRTGLICNPAFVFSALVYQWDGHVPIAMRLCRRVAAFHGYDWKKKR